MSRSEFISKRLSEVLLDGLWIANTNFKKQLESTTWEQSVQKIGDLNTIAALTYHVNYYLAGIINLFEGGGLEIKDQYSFDMPPIKNENDWKKLVHVFILNSEKFVLHVEKMEDKEFDEPFVDVKYGSYLRNIEGVIEHCYYHLGQISLIKKIIEGN